MKPRKECLLSWCPDLSGAQSRRDLPRLQFRIALEGGWRVLWKVDTCCEMTKAQDEKRRSKWLANHHVVHLGACRQHRVAALQASFVGR